MHAVTIIMINLLITVGKCLKYLKSSLYNTENSNFTTFLFINHANPVHNAFSRICGHFGFLYAG